MDTDRHSPSPASSTNVLLAGLAIMVIMVLAMGATLLRREAQPQEPRLVALPGLEAPPDNTTPVVTSTHREATNAADPLPPASAATGPLIDTPKPRIVHPSASEPAVARVPRRPGSKPEPVDDDAQPDVKR